MLIFTASRAESNVEIESFTCVRINWIEDENKDKNNLNCNIQDKDFFTQNVSAVVQLKYDQYNVLIVKSKQEAFQAKYSLSKYQWFDDDDSLVKIHEILKTIRKIIKIYDLQCWEKRALMCYILYKFL